MLPNNVMDLDEAQIFFEWLMVSDPWPLDYGHDLMVAIADETARAHGFDDWIDGYHETTGRLPEHAFSGST